MPSNRHTKQRQLILRQVKLSIKPITTDDICRALARTISRATVYRNVDVLARRGEIFTVDSLDGKRRYVGHAWHEAEFRCQRCRKTRQLKSDNLSNNVNRKMFGQQRVFVATLRTSGLCAACYRALES